MTLITLSTNMQNKEQAFLEGEKISKNSSLASEFFVLIDNSCHINYCKDFKDKKYFRSLDQNNELSPKLKKTILNYIDMHNVGINIKMPPLPQILVPNFNMLKIMAEYYYSKYNIQIIICTESELEENLINLRSENLNEEKGIIVTRSGS